MCRISVVVPVYQAEANLRPLAQSVLGDAPADLELILVEDGSPDNCGAICDELARADARVIALHGENRGVSRARNTGLEHAHGDYVMFLDSDDCLAPGLWGRALPELERHHPDLYVFGVRFSAGGSDLPQPAGLWASPAALPDPADVLRTQMIRGCTLAGPVAKFYRRSTLGELRFDEALRINEDLHFNARFLARCGALVFDPPPFYLCDNSGDGSLSRRLRDDLLDAEAYTRPAFRALLQAWGLPAPEQEALIHERLLHSALAQFGLLAGQKGQLSLARQRDLMRQILAVPGAQKALSDQYRADRNRLLALPYRLCLALHAPGLLAVYCTLKRRFL